MMKLKDLKGFYICKRIFEPSPQSACNGIPYIAENAERIAEEIKKYVESQGCTDFSLERNSYDEPRRCFFGNQFYNLPLIPQEAKGKVEIKTTQYFFIYTNPKGIEKISAGPRIKKAMLTEYGFSLVIPNGILHYHLGKKLS